MNSRYVLLGFSFFAMGCTGEAPTGPTPSRSLSSPRAAAAPNNSKAVSGTPFKGRLEATELVDGDLYHLVGSGNGTQLGQFTYTAEITVDDATGNGVGTVIWTAANGDKLFATTFG